MPDELPTLEDYRNDPTLRLAVQDGLVHGVSTDDLYAEEDAEEQEREERDQQRAETLEANAWPDDGAAAELPTLDGDDKQGAWY